jgi:hypothetical protein
VPGADQRCKRQRIQVVKRIRAFDRLYFGHEISTARPDSRQAA